MAPAKNRRKFDAIETFNQPYRPMTFGGPTNSNTDRIGAVWGSWYYNARKSGRIGITFLSIFILFCLLFIGFILLAMIYGLIKQSRLFDSYCGFHPNHHEQIRLIQKYEKKLAEKQAKKCFKGKQPKEKKEPAKEEMDAGAAGEQKSRRRVRFADKKSDTDGSAEAGGSKESDAEVITEASENGAAVLEREHSVVESSHGLFINQVSSAGNEGEDIYSADGRRPERVIDLRRVRFTPEQQQRLRDDDARRSIPRAARRQDRDMQDMERGILATDTAAQQEVHQMLPSENLTRLHKARLRYEKWSQKK